jgi:hypothetical protein
MHKQEITMHDQETQSIYSSASAMKLPLPVGWLLLAIVRGNRCVGLSLLPGSVIVIHVCHVCIRGRQGVDVVDVVRKSVVGKSRIAHAECASVAEESIAVVMEPIIVAAIRRSTER